MTRLYLAALAAGMLTAAPAHALDIRVDPAPLYVFDLSPDRGGVDLVLHNILIVNDGEGVQEVRGVRVELLAKGEIVSVGRAPADMIARRAERIASYSDAGLLQAMDFQFHLSRLLQPGETVVDGPVRQSAHGLPVRGVQGFVGNGVGHGGPRAHGMVPWGGSLLRAAAVTGALGAGQPSVT